MSINTDVVRLCLSCGDIVFGEAGCPCAGTPVKLQLSPGKWRTENGKVVVIAEFSVERGAWIGTWEGYPGIPYFWDHDGTYTGHPGHVCRIVARSKNGKRSARSGPRRDPK